MVGSIVFCSCALTQHVNYYVCTSMLAACDYTVALSTKPKQHVTHIYSYCYTVWTVATKYVTVHEKTNHIALTIIF